MNDYCIPEPDDCVFYDIETNGLNPNKVWCVVAKHKGVVDVFTDADTFNSYQRSHTGRHWVGHNSLGFDSPVLERLWGRASREYPLELDTLVISRLSNPSRDRGHSLEDWGQFLGFPKGVHTEWHVYSDKMLEYCKQDVDVLEKVYSALREETRGFDSQSIQLEHQVSKIIHKQINNGWLLDQRLCFTLLAELKEKKDELEETVREVFKPVPKLVRVITPKVNADGRTSVVGLKYLGDGCLDLVGGPHTRIDWQEFNLGSRQQIGERLVSLGWEPLKFTPTGQPVVSEEELEDVKDIPEAQLIAEYLMVQKRIAQIQSWLEAVQDDERVHGYVNSNGAVTGRMTHSSPNMAQVPAGRKPYGKECRSCWIVPQGFKLVGADADGLELRMLAHYMNDTAYTQEVLDGDVHTANQKAAGLATRDDAKTFIYAFLYGAGDRKIGSIVGGSAADGKKLKAKFLQNTPALKSLRERVEKAAARGWLKGLDGRKIEVRSSHAALNSLLQGAGAVVMKQALVNLVRMADAQGLRYKLLGCIHDEFQTEVHIDDAEKFGKCAAFSIAKAGRDLNLKCPLAGSYAVGDNWKETH